MAEIDRPVGIGTPSPWTPSSRSTSTPSPPRSATWLAGPHNGHIRLPAAERDRGIRWVGRKWRRAIRRAIARIAEADAARPGDGTGWHGMDRLPGV